MSTYRRSLSLISVLTVLFLLTGCFPAQPEPPSFEFEKHASPTVFAAAGEVITYSYWLKNSDTRSLQAIIADDKLGNPCGFLILEAGQEHTCTVTYTTTAEDVAAGVIRNTATAEGFTTAAYTGMESERTVKTASAEVTLEVQTTTADNAPPAVEIFPELTVEMSASPVGYSKANEIIIYTYTAHNTGFADVQGPFTVVDNRVQQWECDDAGVSGYSLPSDGYIICKGYYRVQPGDICAQVTNTGHIEGTSVSGTVTSNEVGTTVSYVGNCTAPENDPAPIAPQPVCDPPWSPGCQ